MKVMILSDSHSMSKSNLIHLLNAQTVDYYIHCGDIFMSYDTMGVSNFYLVQGNNDFGTLPKEMTITLDHKKFFVTHGHRYYVDFDIETIVAKGKEVQADIICYGHTHAPFLQTIDSILVINPGSVTYPRGIYRKPTYCILNTTTLDVTFYDATSHVVCNPFVSNKEKSSFFKNVGKLKK